MAEGEVESRVADGDQSDELLVVLVPDEIADSPAEPVRNRNRPGQGRETKEIAFPGVRTHTLEHRRYFRRVNFPTRGEILEQVGRVLFDEVPVLGKAVGSLAG